MAKTTNELSARQQKFVDEFLIDLNGRQAAIRAGYSEKGAKVQASRLLTNANIARQVARRRNRLAVKVEVTQEKIIQEYASLAFMSVQDLEALNLPVFGKLSALEALGKHLGLFELDNAQKTKVEVVNAVQVILNIAKEQPAATLKGIIKDDD